jgi:CRISPR/Cas system Type II protein with McrA/HNH and RuvC-like nuclease domain
MIVFLDPNRQTITICDQTVKVYSWSQVHLLASLLQGKDVIYVTDAVETKGEEVLDIILSEASDEEIGDQTHPYEGHLYFHTTKAGTVRFVHQGKEYVFKGAGDMKRIDSLPEDFLDKWPNVVSGLKDGLFEIISEEDKVRIEEELRIKKEDRDSKKYGILMSDEVKAKDFGMRKSNGIGMEATEIDIGGSGGNFRR